MSAARWAALAVAVILLSASAAEAEVTLICPDWSITLDDYGYSDYLIDERFDYAGREFLSGEWAAAVGYKVGSDPARTPIWLTPNFIFPNWTTNSDFSSVSSLLQGADNGDGLPTASGTIANSDLSIHIDAEILDTVTGIAQGSVPASSGGTPGSITSNRYVLKQTYTITNISGETITGIEAFQFLHGLHSASAVYDDRDYGGTMGGYRYDTMVVGTSEWFGGGGFDPWLIEDVLTLHSDLAPTDWEVGYYGQESTDSHGDLDKPTVGVHLSVEAGDLDGSDEFLPPEPWASGAQQYSLGSLNNGDSVSFEVILSLSSTTTVPEPATLALVALGGMGLMAGRIRRRKN